MKRSLCILLIIATLFLLPSIVMAIDCPDGVVISIKVNFNFQFRELRRHWDGYGSFWGTWTDARGPWEIRRSRPVSIQFRFREGISSDAALRDEEIQSCRYALTGSEEKQRLFLRPE